MILLGCLWVGNLVPHSSRGRDMGSECTRKTFGPKWDDVTEEERRLHNEELYDLYCSQNIIRVNK